MIKKLLRVYHTLKYLKPTQLAFFIIRRKFPAKPVHYSGDVNQNSNLELKKPISIKGANKEFGFRFLNVEKVFEKKIDWCPSGSNRLWRYNLHYFDCLREVERSNSEKKALIESWIRENPQGSQPGWEPFTASLRIVNWIFYLQKNDSLCNQNILKSLYEQVLWLEKNDERHILANHYFENLKALAFAASFFEGEDAKRWLTRTISDLNTQMGEQTLSDGGHYERAPQYHALMLENYLDLYNLSNSNQDLFPQDFIDKCSKTANSGLQFLNTIVFPDKQIPLFNDSAFGISPRLDELVNYAKSLGLDYSLVTDPDKLINFPDSGLFGYSNAHSMLIFDAGNIGPSYQPGHTHCDTLSYELMWNNERLIIDTGVCEYEPGELRKLVRSTRAHNTVSVDDQEQSEVWGEFRVARRAKILNSGIKRINNQIEFYGSYRGFPALNRKTLHSRTGTLKLDDQNQFVTLSITDKVETKYSKKIESFVHFHPEVEIDYTESNRLLIKSPDGHQYQLEWDAQLRCSIEDSIYCPEFGLKLDNKRIVLSLENSSHKKSTGIVEFTYFLSEVH